MSFSSVLHKVTPWIATVGSLAVPAAAPLIGIAAKCLSAGLGTPVKGTPDDIEAALTSAIANPDQLAKLKQIDNDFAAQMQQMGFTEIEELLKIDAADRADARAMQVQTRSNMPAMLAWAAVTTMLLCIGMLVFKQLPDTGHDAILILLGAVTVTYKDVYGY